jgi:hypothetical protein
MGYKREVNALVAELEALGYLCPLTKNGHYRVTHPERRGLVFMASTPSDHRSHKNALAQLKREFGFVPASKSAHGR